VECGRTDRVPNECRRRSAALVEDMSATQPRRPAGVPTGGQFASKSQPAPGYTLDADDSPGQATIDGRPVEPETEVFGDGSRIERYRRDGRLHDPDDGRPAVVVYRTNGIVEYEEHYRNGRRHDPDDGRPAFVYYYPDGTVEREEHCRNGRRHDPDDGRPASVDYYPDGTVETAEHWQCGVRQD